MPKTKQEKAPITYSSAGSDLVSGRSRNLDELTVAELMVLPTSPSRPTWKTNSYPVSMEEYNKLVDGAKKPDAVSKATAAMATADGSSADVDIEAEAVGFETQEGEMAATMAPAAPNLTASFDGIPFTGWTPPDCTIGVGPNDVLVAVNTDLAGYSKTGVQKFKWTNMNALFSPVLPSNAQVFDPRVAYDHYAQRWIVVAGAKRESPAGSWLMVGVSQSSDPKGAYWIWALDASLNGSTKTNNWADYPMLGFDTQAIFISSNMFQFNGGFQYAKLRILNKAELYAGGVGAGHTIRWFDFWNLKNPDNTIAFTVQPANHFVGSANNPPAYLINALWDGNGGGSSLTLWTLKNSLGLWTGSTTSISNVSIACQNYQIAPHPKLGASTAIDSKGDTRLLNAIYQYAGDCRRLWTCHTVKYSWDGDTEARSAVHWLEIDIPTNKVIQERKYGGSGKYYFYPAIHTDLNRNAFLVFARSSATEYPNMRQTGRKVTDPLGDLQNSVLVAAGLGKYTGGRWGDYFGICRDGGNSAIVWMYGEYAGTGNTWKTRVCSTKF